QATRCARPSRRNWSGPSPSSDDSLQRAVEPLELSEASGTGRPWDSFCASIVRLRSRRFGSFRASWRGSTTDVDSGVVCMNLRHSNSRYLQVIHHGPGRDRTCDLGIKSGPQQLVRPRESWLKRIVEPGSLVFARALSR